MPLLIATQCILSAFIYCWVDVRQIIADMHFGTIALPSRAFYVDDAAAAYGFGMIIIGSRFRRAAARD